MSLAERAAELTRDRRILTIDIERLPGLARVWEPKTRYVPASAFESWPSLLCFAARWLGDKRYVFRSTWADHADMVQESWNLFDAADIVVTFNGLRFDEKHLKSEWLTAGMPPPKPWKSVDLFAEVRRSFGFESKSLDSVCKRLDLGGKVDRYDADLAFAAVAGDEAAQKRLERYNKGDVALTEKLLHRMHGWLPGHPHLAEEVYTEQPRCNQCGSADLQRNGIYDAITIRYVLYRCSSCGANVRGGRHARMAITRGVR